MCGCHSARKGHSHTLTHTQVSHPFALRYISHKYCACTLFALSICLIRCPRYFCLPAPPPNQGVQRELSDALQALPQHMQASRGSDADSTPTVSDLSRAAARAIDTLTHHFLAAGDELKESREQHVRLLLRCLYQVVGVCYLFWPEPFSGPCLPSLV